MTRTPDTTRTPDMYAHAAVGLPRESLAVVADTAGSRTLVKFRCSGAGQARTVVALWLAAQAMPDGERRLAQHAIKLAPVTYGQPEIDMAAILLRQPRERVRQVINRSWDAVTSAAAGTAALRPLGTTELVASTTQGKPCP